MRNMNFRTSINIYIVFIRIFVLENINNSLEKLEYTTSDLNLTAKKLHDLMLLNSYKNLDKYHLEKSNEICILLSNFYKKYSNNLTKDVDKTVEEEKSPLFTNISNTFKEAFDKQTDDSNIQDLLGNNRILYTEDIKVESILSNIDKSLTILTKEEKKENEMTAGDKKLNVFQAIKSKNPKTKEDSGSKIKSVVGNGVTNLLGNIGNKLISFLSWVANPAIVTAVVGGAVAIGTLPLSIALFGGIYLLINAIKPMLNNLIETSKVIRDFILDKVDKLFEAFMPAIQFWGSMFKRIENGINTVINVFKNPFTSINSYFKSLKDDLKEAYNITSGSKIAEIDKYKNKTNGNLMNDVLQNPMLNSISSFHDMVKTNLKDINKTILKIYEKPISKQKNENTPYQVTQVSNTIDNDIKIADIRNEFKLMFSKLTNPVEEIRTAFINYINDRDNIKSKSVTATSEHIQNNNKSTETNLMKNNDTVTNISNIAKVNLKTTEELLRSINSNIEKLLKLENKDIKETKKDSSLFGLWSSQGI